MFRFAIDGKVDKLLMAAALIGGFYLVCQRVGLVRLVGVGTTVAVAVALTVALGVLTFLAFRGVRHPAVVIGGATLAAISVVGGLVVALT